MNRNRSSIINAGVSLIGMFIMMLANMIIVRLIINNYGSDANGILSTVTQTISMLTLVEAGMTMSFNVSLYKPYVNHERVKIEAILAAAQRVFRLIGLCFFAVGILFSWFYPLFIQSGIPLYIIRSIYIMGVIPHAINYYVAIKYRILFQVAQKEYVINTITYSFALVNLLVTYLLIAFGGSLVAVCFANMAIGVTRYVIIYIPYKRIFGQLNIKNAVPNYKATKGSLDVLLQRVTSVVYSAMPIVFISTFVGSSMASVYTVYSSIFGVIKQTVYAFVNAPQQGFGQLLAERGPKSVRSPFNTYQLLTVMILNSLLVTTVVLAIPFVKLYTSGVTDVNYINSNLVILFLFITCLEVIHIPSGILINISSNFRASRNIQAIATFSMIVTGIAGGILWGVEGILLGKLACNIILSILEIRYAYRVVLRQSMSWYGKVLAVNSFVFALIYVTAMRINLPLDSYLMFLSAGLIYLLMSTLFVFGINYIFFKNNIMELYSRLLRVFIKKPTVLDKGM